MRQELDLPIAKHTIFSDGTSGWLASPQGSRAMLPPELKQVQGETFRMLYHLLAMPDANLVADDTLEFSDSQNTARLVVDPKTNLPLKLTYESAGMTGPTQVQETLSGWRDVNNIKVPFERTVTQAGANFADVHLPEFNFNTPPPPHHLSN